jgi:hypothetical protein
VPSDGGAATFGPVTHAGRSLSLSLSLVTLAMLVASSLTAVSAHAQDDARTMFQRGQVAYSQGAYEDAIAQWEGAYALDPRPLLQWNLSQAYERLGRLEQAAHALELYLQGADPTDEHQTDARARLGAIHERIESTGVILRGGPEGAMITLDGTDAGRLPRPDAIRTTPGSHHIIVRAPGQADFTTTFVVPAGSTTEITVEMTAVASAGGGEIPIAPVVVFSVAGVTLITAAILGGVALSTAGTAPSATSPEADTARGLAIGSDVMFGVSAACAIVGVVLAVLPSGSSSTETSSSSASIRLTPTGFAGTF